MIPGCNAADASNQEDTLKSPTFMNTVREVKTKASTKDQRAGFNTENNNFQPSISLYLVSSASYGTLLLLNASCCCSNGTSSLETYDTSSSSITNEPVPASTSALK